MDEFKLFEELREQIAKAQEIEIQIRSLRKKWAAESNKAVDIRNQIASLLNGRLGKNWTIDEFKSQSRYLPHEGGADE